MVPAGCVTRAVKSTATWVGLSAGPAMKGTAMNKRFVQFANYVAEASGYPIVFAAAVLSVIIWLATGPAFQFSDTWQLVMNTVTSVITFLMVFLIQTSQNRDSTALQAKLDELIRVGSAQNLFVGLEQLSPDEIAEIRERVHGHLERRRKATGD
jgi:low affinity Fe/Cu permease